MTFEIHSDITNRSMTIASRTMRKVLRRKRSILWAIFDWSVFFINALLLIPFDGEPFTLDAGTVISLLVEVITIAIVACVGAAIPEIKANSNDDLPQIEDEDDDAA